jgi:predicted RNA-binding Zn ribbon-like protein
LLSSTIWRSSDTPLLPIGPGTIAEPVCDDDFAPETALKGSSCSSAFIDRINGPGRRWCSMAVSGNRAKQARKRARG